MINSNVVDLSDYKKKKEKEFFYKTMNYITKHLQPTNSEK
jgi:hypothetical protein